MPTKIIVTHEGAMRKKYGRRWRTINAAVRTLVAADKRRGITTVLVRLDDPGFGRWQARPGSPHTFKEAIDHACGLHRRPDYIAILGGPDIVPHQDLANPLTGDDRKDDPVVPSDLPYACDAPASDDISTFLGPSRAVGRIPDLPKHGDPRQLLRVLALAARWTPPVDLPPGFFGLSARVWRRSTTASLKALFGAGARPRSSPDDGPAWSVAELRPRWHFINCHGAPVDTRFYGQQGEQYPPAHDARLLTRKIARGTLAVAECCYGAQLFDPSLATGPGICLTYLLEGAIGFMGSTTVAYGPATRNNYADLMCRFFLESARGGASLGRAMLEARQRFVKEAAPINPIDLKTMAQFLVLGDPSARALERTVRPGARAGATRLVRHARQRVELEATAAALTRGIDSVAPSSDAPAPRAVQSRLALEAAAAGYVPTGPAQTFAVRKSPNPGARRLVDAGTFERPRFHVMSAKPGAGRQARPGRPGRKKPAPGEGDIPKRMLLLGREVAGKLVQVDRVFAHASATPHAMSQSFEGHVVRKRVSAGSKSEHNAVMLDTGHEELVLRRRGGNAFRDAVLEDLVGHRIRGTGERVGCTLILRDWVELKADL